MKFAALTLVFVLIVLFDMKFVRVAAQVFRMAMPVPELSPDQEAPPSVANCPSGSSCVYSNLCCPLPFAQPCGDNVHCCPSNTTCNTLKGLCEAQVVGMNQVVSVPWERTFTQSCTPHLSLKQPVGAKSVCPDQHYCDDSETCCMLPSRDYGCCPLPSAVCCADQQHCCPNGYQCDTSHARCIRSSFENSESELEEISFSDLRKSRGSRSSPLPYGAKPARSLQELRADEQRALQQTFEQLAATKKFRQEFRAPQTPPAPAQTRNHPTVKAMKHDCPDNKSNCPDFATCCLLKDGVRFGCCPITDAVCCNDFLHCCPDGSVCDVEHHKCVRSSASVDLDSQERQDSALISLVMHDKPESEDKVSQRDAPVKKMDLSDESRYENKSVGVGNQVCPDGRSWCPDAQTCCSLSSGAYGCCPYTNAVCCADRATCCPFGYLCNIQQHLCIRPSDKSDSSDSASSESDSLPSLSVEAVEQTAAEEPKDSERCPDKKSQCSDDQSCCPIESGGYGCCSFKNAVCCDDKIHCCPDGTKCNLAEQQCERESSNWAISFSSLEKKPSASRRNWISFSELDKVIKVEQSPAEDDTNQCPDHQSQCSDMSTCCKLKTGRYGCCPLKSAVCCDDGVHCCPTGTKCDMEHQRCTREGATEAERGPDPRVDQPDLFERLLSGRTLETMGYISSTGHRSPLLPVIVPEKDSLIACADGTSFCSANSTCCGTSDHQYGCCPHQNGVCCQDQEHCCPRGSKCDLSIKGCVTESNIGEYSEPLQKRSHSKLHQIAPKQELASTCAQGSTCCNGGSCCPLLNAKCCSDGRHCCPSNTSCNVIKGICETPIESVWVPWESSAPSSCT